VGGRRSPCAHRQQATCPAHHGCGPHHRVPQRSRHARARHRPLAALADTLPPGGLCGSGNDRDLFTAAVFADLAATTSGTSPLTDVARTGLTPARRLLARAALRYQHQAQPASGARPAANPTADDRCPNLPDPSLLADRCPNLPDPSLLADRYRTWAGQLLPVRRERKAALAQVADDLRVTTPVVPR